MKDNSGKVLLALLAGASAGIVAGLLMAPEAGNATRESWGKSLGKFGDDLNKLLQDGLSKLDSLKGDNGGADGDADRSGAEDALAGMAGGAGKAGKSNGSGQSNAGNQGASGGSGRSGASTSGGANTGSASTASSSRTTDAGNDAGGTTGGSGVGS